MHEHDQVVVNQRTPTSATKIPTTQSTTNPVNFHQSSSQPSMVPKVSSTGKHSSKKAAFASSEENADEIFDSNKPTMHHSKLPSAHSIRSRDQAINSPEKTQA